MQTIKEARELKGVTQEQLAKRLKLSRQTLAKYEDNPRAMTLGMAERLCFCLDCDINDIFFSSTVSKTQQ